MRYIMIQDPDVPFTEADLDEFEAVSGITDGAMRRYLRDGEVHGYIITETGRNIIQKWSSRTSFNWDKMMESVEREITHGAVVVPLANEVFHKPIRNLP